MSTARNLVCHSIIATLLASVAAVSAVTMRAGALNAKPTTPTSIEASNHWLPGLEAKHKQFFDNPSPNGGIALMHVMNYYDTYNKAST